LNSRQTFKPAYLTLQENNQLQVRAEQAYQHMADCDLCARYCHVDRYAGIKGAVCRTGLRARVNSYGPHHGEEDPLRGVYGSGTIFFSWCSLRCVFCQNWEISQKGLGHEVEPEDLIKYGDELVLRAPQDAKVIRAASELTKIKNMDSDEARELIKTIAICVLSRTKKLYHLSGKCTLNVRERL